MIEQDRGILASQLDALKEAAESLGAAVGFDIVYGEERTARETPLWTFIIALSPTALFAAYSAIGIGEIKAYAQGFASAMRLMSGTYNFKPLTDEARMRPRRPLVGGAMPLGMIRDKRTRYSAKTMPRFAATRRRFSE